MSYLTQMAGPRGAELRLGRRRARRPRRASIRGFARRSTSDARQLLGRPLPLDRLHPAAARGRRRRVPDLAGRAADASAATRPRRRSQGAHADDRARPGRVAGSRSSMLGTNGGGFYNSNSAVPFENPNGLTNFIETDRDPADPDGRGLHVREDGARPPPRAGRCSPRCSSLFALGVGDHLAGRAARLGGAAQLGREPRRESAAQSGGNMTDKEVRFGIADTALWATSRRRDASNGSVNGGLRRADAARRRRAARQHLPRRGDLRRRRLGPLRDVLLHHHRGLRRRPDGRPHARVPRQEDRGARDQATRRSARSSCRRWCSR